MRPLTANDIKTEIIEITMAFYYYSNIKISLEPIFGQLNDIIEIVSFIFENYLRRFSEIVKRKTIITLTEEAQRAEKQLMISWISLEILNELRRTENTY
jgi:hypothetical protein